MYTLQASAYQMAVLLLFNDARVLALPDMAAATGMEESTLTAVLDILVKAHILEKVEARRCVPARQPRCRRTKRSRW